MARPRSPLEPEAWKLYIPAALKAKMDLILRDPRTGKPKYAERSRIVTQLLETWLDTLTPRVEGALAETTIVVLPIADHVQYTIGKYRISSQQLSHLAETHLAMKELSNEQPSSAAAPLAADGFPIR